MTPPTCTYATNESAAGVLVMRPILTGQPQHDCGQAFKSRQRPVIGTGGAPRGALLYPQRRKAAVAPRRMGTGCYGTRGIWRELDCPKSNVRRVALCCIPGAAGRDSE